MRKPRAIIYDDEVLILEMLRAFFTERGYEVLTFDEPSDCPIYEHDAEGCDRRHQCADVIISDRQMPRMSGIELLRRQAQRGCKLDIRNKTIISGDANEEDRRAIDELGCAFFPKPLDLSKFSEWLGDCEKRMDLSLPLGFEL